MSADSISRNENHAQTLELPTSPTTTDETRARKRQRTARACDRCNRTASQCVSSIDSNTCLRCEEQGIKCTYDRPVKRRGPVARRDQRPKDTAPGAATTTFPVSSLNLTPLPEAPLEGVTSQSGPSVASRDDVGGGNSCDIPTPGPGNAPSPISFPIYDETQITHSTVKSLVDVFYHSAYPIRPYFHWPTFCTKVENQLYRTEWSFFIVTMAVCALAAGRLCDGVDLPSEPHALKARAPLLSSQCYTAAIAAIPNDLINVPDHYALMRAKAILASTCLQSGDLRRAVDHLGNYLSLSINMGFASEANWPTDLTEIDKQERRRLFWGVYQQEQYLASRSGFTSRQREAKASVLYPAEVWDDVDITEIRVNLRPDKSSFLRGWNLCTDLYRLLEHADDITKDRTRDTHEDQGNVGKFLARLRYPKEVATESLQFVTKLYDDLPLELKKVRAFTGDAQQDRYGYIASNVLITTQTLKMLLVGSQNPSVHARCAIASELLDELSTIPVAFFYASSTTTLQHLAHVGHLLGSVIQTPLSPWTYLQVRNILLVLANFLDKIESTRRAAPGLASQLRSQISRIDESMRRAPKHNNDRSLLSMGRDLLLGWGDVSNIGSFTGFSSDDPGYLQLDLTTPDQSAPTTSDPLQTMTMNNNTLQQSIDSLWPSGDSMTPAVQQPLPNGASRQADTFGSGLSNDSFLDKWPFSTASIDFFDSLATQPNYFNQDQRR